MKQIWISLLTALLFFSLAWSEELTDHSKNHWSVVLIPTEKTLQDIDWLKGLGHFKNIKITLALSDSGLKKISKDRLGIVELINDGSLELALRLSTRSLSQDTLREARTNFKNFCGEFPKGFVSDTGSLSLEQARLLIHEEFNWTVTAGSPAFTSRGETLAFKRNVLSSERLLLFQADPLSNLLHGDEINSSTSSAINQLLNGLEKLNSLWTSPVIVWDEAYSQWNMPDLINDLHLRVNSKKMEMVLTKNLGEWRQTPLLNPENLEPTNWSWIEGTPQRTLKISIRTESSENQVQFIQDENGPTLNLFLQGFSVEVSSENIESPMVSYLFRFKSDALEKTQKIHLYMDINHRLGAGKTSLFGNSAVELPPENGWEYELFCENLTPNNWNCQLLSAFRPMPIYVTLGQIEEDKKSLKVQIPKRLLGRDPLRWAYLVCIMDTENHILDLLSSLENKGELLYKLQQGPNTNREKILLLPIMKSK